MTYSKDDALVLREKNNPAMDGNAPLVLTMPPQQALPVFWQEYFQVADQAIQENFWGNLVLLKEAYQNQDAYALQLKEAGYQFADGMEAPASFYDFITWSLKQLQQLVRSGQVTENDILIPAKAFEVENGGEKTYHFICFGKQVPENARELNLLSPKLFVDMLSSGYFPIGAPIREHTNQTLCEHDIAHISGFISSPRYMKTLKQAFKKVQQVMENNTLIKEALYNFDSLYSLRLYYMIEIFSAIPEENLKLLEQTLSIKIADFSLDDAPEQIYPKVLSLLKSKSPAELNQYLYRFYSHFSRIVNPLGGESRDILNRSRKFGRSNQAGSFYSSMSNLDSKFDGSSIYSMFLNAKATLVNKRSNHSDYQIAIEEIHAPFIAAMIGTSQLTIEDWIMQAVEEIPNPESKLYKYICDTKLWNKSHVLYWAYGFYDCTKVLTKADVTKNNIYFSHDEIAKTIKQLADIKDHFLHQDRTQLNPDGKSISTCMMITRFEKYNVPKVAEVSVTEKSVQGLLEYDSKIKGLPKFMSDFLDMKPSRNRELIDSRPELIEWCVDNKYLLLPNPEQTNLDMLLDDPKLARQTRTGFGLIAWYIHPLILENSQYVSRKEIIEKAKQRGESLRYGELGSKDNVQKLHRVDSLSFLNERDESQPTKEELEKKSGVPYLSGPFTYTVAQLADLRQLKEDIIRHLKEHYGVTDADKVDLYFHTHYSIDTNTAHLHIRVNQLHHGLELDKSIDLDEVITCLEKGKEVKSIFIERRYLHTELRKLSFLTNLGYEVHEVNNPYRVEVTQGNNNVTYHLVSK